MLVLESFERIRASALFHLGLFSSLDNPPEGCETSASSARSSLLLPTMEECELSPIKWVMKVFDWFPPQDLIFSSRFYGYRCITVDRRFSRLNV